MDPGKTAGFRRPPERLLPNPKAKLRDQLQAVCRFKRMSERTEEAYWGWAKLGAPARAPIVNEPDKHGSVLLFVLLLVTGLGGEEKDEEDDEEEDEKEKDEESGDLRPSRAASRFPPPWPRRWRR